MPRRCACVQLRAAMLCATARSQPAEPVQCIGARPQARAWVKQERAAAPVFRWGQARSGNGAAAARICAAGAAAPVCTSMPAAQQRLALATAESLSSTPCRCCTPAPACWKYAARAPGVESGSYLESVKSVVNIITTNYCKLLLSHFELLQHHFALLHWHYYHVTTCYCIIIT